MTSEEIERELHNSGDCDEEKCLICREGGTDPRHHAGCKCQECKCKPFPHKFNMDKED